MLFTPYQAEKELDDLMPVLALIFIADAVYEAVHELNFKPIADVSSMLLDALVD